MKKQNLYSKYKSVFNGNNDSYDTLCYDLKKAIRSGFNDTLHASTREIRNIVSSTGKIDFVITHHYASNNLKDNRILIHVDKELFEAGDASTFLKIISELFSPLTVQAGYEDGFGLLPGKVYSGSIRKKVK